MPTAIAYSPLFSRHVTPFGHPESPKRTEVIYQAIKPLNLPLLDIRPASFDELCLVHSPRYVELVQEEVARLPKLEGKIPVAMLSTGDVTICPDSFEVAKLAAGAALACVDAVMQKKATSAFANSRPPAHHATSDRGMGFCLFNHVAIACRYVQKKYQIERVAIIDWDLHHGNGTQDIFYRDPSVFYFSTHQAGIYTGTGWEEERGVGNILNCPIEPGKSSVQAIFDAFENKLAPAMKTFQPEFVFISAGFDAHQDDPLGNLELNEAHYALLTSQVRQIAQSYAQDRLVSILEGGYNLRALAASAKAHIQQLHA